MRAANVGTNLDPFFLKVRNARSRAMLLDYDGTLAPFRVHREEAKPHPAIATSLNTILEAGHTHVAIVSGRGIDDLLPLLSALVRIPEIWGSHGWERRRADGTREVVAISETARDALSAAKEGARASGFLNHCESKPVSVAVHWRGMDRDEQIALESNVREKWGELSNLSAREAKCDRSPRACVLEWHEFDGGVELRVPGRDKGDAVRAILEELGREAVIAYAGDDRTDEDAFAAVGDHGLSILVRSELRKTCATLWLESCEKLAEFLTRWHRVCTTGV